MKTEFARTWNRSKKPRKQRKFIANAPIHIKRKLLGCHLDKALKEKYGRRNIIIKKGDKVKILRGQFKKKTGVVDRVNTKKSKVYVQNIEVTKRDGSKAFYPLHPSNLIITELNLEDKRRLKNEKPPEENIST